MFLIALLDLEFVSINLGENKGIENKRVKIRIQDSVKTKS